MKIEDEKKYPSPNLVYIQPIVYYRMGIKYQSIHHDKAMRNAL
jgi:hypothetical protein